MFRLIRHHQVLRSLAKTAPLYFNFLFLFMPDVGCHFVKIKQNDNRHRAFREHELLTLRSSRTQNKVARTGQVHPLECSLHVVIALNYVKRGIAKQTLCYLSCSLLVIGADL
jgi:hypothetical protein